MACIFFLRGNVISRIDSFLARVTIPYGFPKGEILMVCGVRWRRNLYGVRCQVGDSCSHASFRRENVVERGHRYGWRCKIQTGANGRHANRRHASALFYLGGALRPQSEGGHRMHS